MATEVGNIYYSLDLDDEKFKSGMKASDAHAKSFSDRLGETTNASAGLLGGLTVLAAGAVAFGVASVKAADESNQALAQLDAVLKSTGSAAGVTKKQVTDLATELEHQTGVSDEAVVSAQSMLLTFTSIGKDVFPGATKTVLDMATALNGGAIPSAEAMRNQAILLGKALQDPDAGLGALHRVGVNTDELAKKFTASMSIQEKQRLILQELNTEFGGSAKAAGQTFAGAIAKLTQIFGDFQESVGGAIESALVPFINVLSDFVNWLAQQDPMALLKQGFEAIQPYIPAIAGAFTAMLLPAIIAAGAAIVNFVIALGPLAIVGAAIGLVLGHVADRMGGWGNMANFAKDKAIELWNALDPLLKLLTPIYQNVVALGVAFMGWYNDMGGASGIIKAARDNIVGFYETLVNLYKAISSNQVVILVFNTAVGILRDIWNGLFSIFTSIYAFVVNSLIPGIQQFIQTMQTSGIITTIITIITVAVGLLVAAFKILWPAIVDLANTIITQLFPALMNLWNAIAPLLLPVLNVLLIVLGAVAAIIIGAIIGALWLAINVIKILVNVFATIIQVVSFVVGVVASILGGLVNIISLPFRIAVEVVRGIFSGQSIGQIFGNVLGVIGSVLGGVWSAITNPFRNAFNWVTDSVNQLAKTLADKLNPFQRHSPSLYDLVSKGTQAMGGAYQDFFDGVNESAVAFKPNVTTALETANSAGLVAPGGKAGGQEATTNNYDIGTVILKGAEAVDEFFNIGNRNTQLELAGGSPLPGTSGV